MTTPNERRLPRWFVRVGLGLALLPAAVCRGEAVNWPEPDIDTWVYPNAFVGAGTRVFAPTFGAGFALEPGAGALTPGDATRIGNFVFAFETTEEIEPGLDPSRYAIESVTVTATSERGQGGSLVYETTPLTPESVLADVAAGDFGATLPMELFAVGFAGGFEGFALGVEQSGQRFSEANESWSAGHYNLFAADSVTGSDATNNLNGGFSATESSGETDAFAAAPLAIGLVPGASEGDLLPGNTTFEFQLDLQSPGVLDYVREGLSAGVLGFALSSLQTGGFPDPNAGSPYPQWYTKEANGLFPNAAPPTLTIEVAILPAPGDFNADGTVDSLDYDSWSAAFGSTVDTPGTGADGNGDGVVNAADYAAWRDSLQVATVAVPEPGAGAYVIVGVATVTFCVGTVTFTRPRRPFE